MDSPSTSFHLRNDKASDPTVQLSLLEHEEATASTEVGPTGTRLPDSGNGIIVPGWEPKITPPPKHPPRENACFVLRCFNHFVVTVILTSIFLLCLPILLIIYITVGLVPRFFVRLILRCSNGGRYSLMAPSRGFGSTNGNHHTVLLVVRGRCDIDKVRAQMMNVVNSISNVTGQRKFLHLQKRVDRKFGYLCLENRYSKFDIKNHVKHFDIRRKNVVVDMGDIIPYLESTYDKPFENVTTVPQWELLVVPKFAYRDDEAKLLHQSDQKRFYALIFRFHHGIMDWNMFQEMLVEFVGKSAGKIRSPFCPPKKKTMWENVKTLLAVVFIGPQTCIKQVWKKWRRFATVRTASPRISLAVTKPMDSDAFEDIKTRTYTSVDSVLGGCVRIATRNLVLGQNLELPSNLSLARVFNTMSSEMQGVDSLTINYHKYRIPLERLQATFHAIEWQEGVCFLAGQRIFNKMLILLAGVFPYYVSAWLYKALLKSDVVMEICPGTDEPCQVFGGDLVADMFGWSGISGVDADFKATVTTYCGRVRANFTGKLGYIGSQVDAQILANEFEEEFKKLASTAGLYQSRIFLPPAVEMEISLCVD